MQSLVLDTNILLDLFVFNDPAVIQLKEALIACRFKAFASQESLLELADVISRPLFSLEAAKQKDILEQWQALTYTIDRADLHPAPWKCKDPDDQVFLDTAFTVRPAILISKDLALLELANKASQEHILITKDCSQLPV
ncbi:putative toxin-antitoxin system toxin component, PIN family [Polynucleobacter sphagniphilus]|jgi:putative PIN family toxin of toxin-antitoxin system|uniref:putative toxin-antitoxin system toxin component, PIN family n=1 Tax=Polynucleobacter sphagniphilus TaxID=1743169 RepID=UPI00096BA7A9|nr:putative toxin-antitoxin system toxin component, PIN family [Polynucleobacter sphagniphilus]MDH6241122.1 putative PIN family toxin of toxin-antitoxin system [Polynucleobacter sphagniphilus]MDH6248742.1 putative PIN family toxin of toxin-antitoxin system [Polynucleobacter sphagniphilus]MDH6524468.1 putative PIN family toxin of toxin-antitoxin system [Polynucleobacter sphagniphilus]OLY95882.1 putative toxin-antitoxin system toxin component, PIN family [Polynucleobacter sphagniphilus]